MPTTASASHPDANTRQQAVSRICELQWESEEAARISALPNRTKDDVPFELLANCYGQEDIESALQAGASGVGLLRSGYMMLPGRPVDEQEQFVFYQSCIAAAKGGVVTVRTFDFGVNAPWLISIGAGILQAGPAGHPQQPAPDPSV